MQNNRVTLNQIRKFIISGGGATACHFGVMWLLINFKVYATLATAIGMMIGAVINYFLQYNWTFKADISHLTSTRNYIITVILSFISNTFLFWLCYDKLYINILLSQIITSIIVALQNYLIYKKFVFLRNGALYEA